MTPRCSHDGACEPSDGAYGTFSRERVARIALGYNNHTVNLDSTRKSMADDRSIRGGQDRTRVNMDQDYEARYWSEKWGVSQEELRSAVKQVGPMVSDLEKHFGSRQSSRSN